MMEQHLWQLMRFKAEAALLPSDTEFSIVWALECFKRRPPTSLWFAMGAWQGMSCSSSMSVAQCSSGGTKGASARAARWRTASGRADANAFTTGAKAAGVSGSA